MAGLTRGVGGLAALGVSLGLLTFAPGALAATGDLAYRGCISAESASSVCTLIPDASANGADTGLDVPQRAEVSSDGLSVYTSSVADDAIAHFTRNPADGSIAYAGCLTGDTAVAACTPIASASASGNSGLDQPTDVKVSPNGRSVYLVASGDTAVARLARDPGSGALSFASCISGETETAGTCSQVSTATAGGTDSGFDDPEALTLSPDGRSLYLLSQSDFGVASFELDAAGDLAFSGCLSADSVLAACTPVAGAAPGATDTGFSSLQAVAISADGRSLYTVDDADDAIAHFSRDPATGGLTFAACLTADTTIAPCAKLPGAAPNGIGTGMRSLVDVATSPDLSSVYAVGDSEETVIHYRRDLATGALSFESCHTGAPAGTLCSPIPGADAANDGMGFANALAVGPDARSVDVAAASDAAITRFARDPLTGSLSHAGCLSADTLATACVQIPGAAAGGADTGLDGARGLAASPDGRSLYAAAGGDDALARFDREADAAGPALALTGKKRARGKKVTVTATCADEFCATVEATAKLTVKLKRKGNRRKRRRAPLTAAAAADLQPGQPAALTLKLGRKARKLLRKAGKGKVAVTATAADLLANESVAKRSVKLKRKRR